MMSQVFRKINIRKVDSMIHNPRKVFIIIAGFLVMGCFVYHNIHTMKDLCHHTCGCYKKKFTEDDPIINLKRQISFILLKAADDVRSGRQMKAVADLEAATAKLQDSSSFYKAMMSSKRAKPILPPNFDRTLTPSAMEELKLTEYDFYNLFHRDREKNTRISAIDKQNMVSTKVTIIIDECGDMSQNEIEGRLNNLISQIRKLWPRISVVVGLSMLFNDSVILLNYEGVTLIKTNCDNATRVQMEELMEYVETPFILYLRTCAAITSDLNLFRLMELASNMKAVGVVGMSERGADGGWDYSCSQLKRENSHLAIIEGYEFSKDACLICDVTSNSFVAVTQVIRAILPDSSLPESSRHIDWSLRLRMAGVVTITCPEIMMHTTKAIMKADSSLEYDQEHYPTIRRSYIKLARKWQLTAIHLSDKSTLEYSCSDINFKCNAKSLVRQYMLPPCCTTMKLKMIEALNIMSKEALIPYEIKAGTLLGAVKFKNALPWDFDDDCRFPNKFANILKKKKQRLKDLGVPSFSCIGPLFKNGQNHEYFVMSGLGGFDLELWGVDAPQSIASSEELKKIPGYLVCLQYGHYPIEINTFLNTKDIVTERIIQNRREIYETKRETNKTYQELFPPIPKKSCFLQSFVRLGDHWVVSSWNPALEIRERVGNNLFKHEAHWRYEKIHSSWPTCSYPGHPLCLDIHPRDGNIPFL